MLEDLHTTIVAIEKKLTEMGFTLTSLAKKKKIAELEYKMGEPTFWDDPDQAQKSLKN